MTCDCSSGFVRDRVKKLCKSDPEWCTGPEFCRKGSNDQNSVCCKFAPCDTGVQNRCKISRENCLNLIGCGGATGTVVE